MDSRCRVIRLVAAVFVGMNETAIERSISLSLPRRREVNVGMTMIGFSGILTVGNLYCMCVEDVD